MRLLTATPTIRRLTIGSNRWCTRCDMKEGTARKAFYYLFTLLAGHTPLQDLSWAMLMYQDLDAPITNTVGVLSSLAGYCNLRDLEIYYRNSCAKPTCVRAEEPMDLTRGYNCLKRIELHTSTSPYAIEAPGVTDAYIEMLATLLPHLRELKLGMDTDLSTQSLLSFSVYCPELRETRLGGRFDLSFDDYTDHILFPNLRSLDVKHLSYDEQFPAKYYATMMQYHAPQMWGLLLYYGEFEEEVKTAFSDLRMVNYGMERLRREKAIDEYWEGKQTLHYPYSAIPWAVESSWPTEFDENGKPRYLTP